MLLLLVAMLLMLPAIAIFWTDDAERSRWENRSLSSFPHLLGAGSDQDGFFDGLEVWINDHFGFALPLNRLHRKLVFYVFSDPPSPQISLGSSGFVYLNSHGAHDPHSALRHLCGLEMPNQNYASLLSDWSAVIKHFQGPSRHVVLGISPTKPVVYPDYLPPSVPRKIRDGCMEYQQDPPLVRMVMDLRRRGLSAVYPLQSFIARRFDDNFYPKESFHFSGLSAHLFAEELLEAVDIRPPESWQVRIEKIEQNADMKRLFGFQRKLRAPDYDYTAFGVGVAHQQPEFVKQCYPRALDFGTYEARAPITERAALLLSDSFGHPTATHLAPAYRTLTWINVTHLTPEDGEAFFTSCLQRIQVDDLFFVFQDGDRVWAHRLREQLSRLSKLQPQ